VAHILEEDHYKEEVEPDLASASKVAKRAKMMEKELEKLTRTRVAKSADFGFF